MDRARISQLAHADRAVAAPVSEARVAQLVSALAVPEGGSALDLGCGSGAWVLALAARHPGTRCTGVDVSGPALDQGRAAAARQGADVTWVQGEAADIDGRYDVVLCVGASHAFGGLAGTLRAVRARLVPGGQALVGDTIWERPPSAAAQQALEAGPDDYPDLAGLVRAVQAHGFEVGGGHVSTPEEWDDYEWAWTGALVRWAAVQPADSSEGAAALHAAQEHRAAWLDGYRGELGFATLHLLDVA